MRSVVVAVLTSSLLAVPTFARAQDLPAPVANPPSAAPAAPAPDTSALPATPRDEATPTPAPPPRPAQAAPAPVPWDAIPPVSSTDEKPRGHQGFEMNLSVGYSFPLGNSTGAQGDQLSSTFTGQVPISLEIGGNLDPSFFMGLYGTYAFGGVASTVTGCQSGGGLDCSAHSLRAGITFEYRFLPGETLRPWIGYGIGYEWQNASLTNSVSGASGTFSIRGWEFAHFKAGFDVQTSPSFGIGPLLDFGIGQYGHMHADDPSQTLDQDVTTTAIHEWFTIGVRASFAP